MKIETKHNLGDEVWVVDKDKRIYRGKIKIVRIYSAADDVFIDYFIRSEIDWSWWIAEQAVFSNEEELLKSL